jgi:hypothetical protein
MVLVGVPVHRPIKSAIGSGGSGATAGVRRTSAVLRYGYGISLLAVIEEQTVILFLFRMLHVRQNTIPELDAASDGPLCSAGRLLPIALALSGQRREHLPCPRTMTLAVQLDMPFKVVSEVRDLGPRIAPGFEQPFEHFRYYIFTPEEEKGRYLHQRAVNCAA